MRLRALVLGLCLMLGSITTVFPQSLHAAGSAYVALQVTTTGAGSLTLDPGEVKTVTMTFQNIGTTTWKNDGAGYISLYTYEPKYRTSVFDPGTWLSPTQVKRMQEASVAPGATATISFELHAPQTTGTYTETFALASESTAWVTGGQVTFKIVIEEEAATAIEEQAEAVPEDAEATTGSITAQTATKLKVKAGKSIPFMLAVKNTGTATWNNLSLTNTSEATKTTNGDRISFAHTSWSDNEALALKNQSIAPGQTATLQFFMTTPQANGEHVVEFSLSANGEEVIGASLELPIEITGGSEDLDEDSSANVEDEEDEPTAEEPDIRVGVLIVDEETDWEVRIGSQASDVELRNADGALLLTISEGSDIRAAYEDGIYVYGSGATEKTSSLPLRFIPTTPNAVLEVTNFDRRVTRGTSYANNTFRNVLELRYNATKDRTWLINELPIEYYLRGLAETSNSSPQEYQKAIITAARSYAYYIKNYDGKHAAEGYHVDAYRDQVYWGYGQEERNPLITQAVEATDGHIVTYNDTVAITSYFSRSDGRTRNWSDVWGRSVPYAVSVAVPCDEGKTLWGHGVGMSASGAICMANDGKTWKEILTYFYTGVEIQHEWK